MISDPAFSRSGFERDSMPLDSVRTAFEWLVRGPCPVSVDGRLFAGLPQREVPLDELRDLLLRRHCPQVTRDAVWAHLVLLSRTRKGTWTVGAVGVALPALTTIVARLSAKFAGDPSDIHAAVLAGFVAELAEIDLRKPRIMLRLRWAAYRAGHGCVREALDAPVPSGHGFCASAPPAPWGHPDLVLARAVADHAITAAEAELIGDTRLEDVPLAIAAQERDMSYEAAKKARQRAERRLVTYLQDDAVTEPSAEHDVTAEVAARVTITEAARAASTSHAGSPCVAELQVRRAEKSGRRVSPSTTESGVQRCGRRSAASATSVQPARPDAPAGQSPEVPRCA